MAWANSQEAMSASVSYRCAHRYVCMCRGMGMHGWTRNSQFSALSISLYKHKSWICKCVCVHGCICMCVCVCVFVQVCTYIHMPFLCLYKPMHKVETLWNRNKLINKQANA